MKINNLKYWKIVKLFNKILMILKIKIRNKTKVQMKLQLKINNCYEKLIINQRIYDQIRILQRCF